MTDRKKKRQAPDEYWKRHGTPEGEVEQGVSIYDADAKYKLPPQKLLGHNTQVNLEEEFEPLEWGTSTRHGNDPENPGPESRPGEVNIPALDLGDFGKLPEGEMRLPEMDFTEKEKPLEVTMGEVEVSEAPSPEYGPEYRPEELKPDLFAAEPRPSEPPMVQARPAPASPAKENPVQEFIKSKLGKRPEVKDNAGWGAALGAFHAATGFKGPNVYALEREQQEGAQKRWESDRNAEQQLIMQAIAQKFQGEQKSLDRGFHKEQNALDRGSREGIASANLQSEEQRAIAAETGRQDRAARQRELQEAIAADRIAQSDTNSRRATETSTANNLRTNATNERIFNARQVDAGVKDLSKSINAGTAEGITSIDQQINSPNGDRLLEGVTGVGSVFGKAPLGIGPALVGQDRADFNANYKQTIMGMRHDVAGASLTKEEKALFDEAMGVGLSGNPQTARAAWTTMKRIHDKAVQQHRAGVRPEAVEKFKLQGGYVGDDEEWERTE